MKRSLLRPLVSASLLLLCSLALPNKLAAQQSAPLAEQIEDLKKSMIKLNRDLFVLEQDLLFPSSTQVAVYLSMDVGTYFQLDSVQLKLDDQDVTHYLYTERQVSALIRGGVQQLYLGNIAQGQHQLTAFFIGTGPQDKPYKRAVTLTFDKSAKSAALELVIRDSSAKQQPEFVASQL